MNKVVNIRRHYESKHKAAYDKIVGKSRKDEYEKLKCNLQKQVAFFIKKVKENKKSTRASYEVAKLIAERMKLFAKGQFVK